MIRAAVARCLPKTLRGRLVGLLVVVLAIGFAAAAAVTALVVRSVLTNRLDAQLYAAGDRLSVSLEHSDHDADNHGGSGGGPPIGQIEGQAAGTLGARLYGGRVTDAAIVGDGDTADPVPAAARRILAAYTGPTGPTSIALPGLGEYRVIVVAGRDGDLQVTGLPSEPIERTIDELVTTVAAVFGVTLLVIAVAAAALVRVRLRPLARMSRTADEVADLPLTAGAVSVPHRVDEHGHGSEVDSLARAFNSMLDEMESALQSRAEVEDRLRRFIADASHELRTPIAAIRGHADLARRTAREDPVRAAEAADHALERVAVQSERMGRVVEDLLLLARLDSGRPLARERVDLTELVLDTVGDARTTAPDHRWQLAVSAQGITVCGDRHALGQVLANVLANAGLHTPAGTKISISVMDHDDDGRRVARVTVADDGPGMPSDIAARAFDRFVRGDNRRSIAQGSSGLGLPIVAAIVAAHHGAVRLESTSAGTSVVIDLPMDGESPLLRTGE